MISGTLSPTCAKILHHEDISNDDIASLADDLKSCGFKTEIRIDAPGPQGAMEWALPSLTTISMAATVGIGTLAGKKFFDGFLEELGVKNLGSKVAQSLKRAFDAGTKSTVFYFSKFDKDGKPVPKARPTPLRLSVRFGSDTLADPLWCIAFVFTRALDEEHLSLSINCIPDHIDQMYKIRGFLLSEIYIKISNTEKFYGREIGPDHVWRDIASVCDLTSGTYIFDVAQKRWVKVAKNISMFSHQDFLGEIGRVLSTKMRP